MKRRKFITTSMLSVPALALGQTSQPPKKNPGKGLVVKANKNRFNEKTKLFGANPIDIKVSTKDTDGAFSISEYIGNTKGGPPLHIHLHQDEVFIILEGEILFQLGEEQFHLTAGDTVFIPRNVPHAPCQLSDKSRYFYFFTPSGTMEDFFRGLGELKVDKQATPEQMAKLFADHDMKIVGPPLQF
ncbi:MAG: cupin domain-containing protein [Sediminibacterium sp.]|nr:cupin domain-containing protein [Sediminibacterium sp.]MBX9779821.1 cupin domain-containing protein [Chitinophagaceae bacterium]